jgi:hypothetical protein
MALRDVLEQWASDLIGNPNADIARAPAGFEQEARGGCKQNRCIGSDPAVELLLTESNHRRSIEIGLSAVRHQPGPVCDQSRALFAMRSSREMTGISMPSMPMSIAVTPPQTHP